MEEKKPNTKLISLGVLVAVVLLVVVVSVIDKRNKKATADSAAITTAAQAASAASKSSTLGDTTATTPTTSTTPTTTTTTSSGYKAGTYTAEGSYQTPDEQDAIKITVTITADGTITDTSAVSESNSPESSEYQNRFISGYKSQVVGKNIATLKLGTVSGSSLTPIGFNEAIATIASQAKA